MLILGRLFVYQEFIKYHTPQKSFQKRKEKTDPGPQHLDF